MTTSEIVSLCAVAIAFFSYLNTLLRGKLGDSKEIVSQLASISTEIGQIRDLLREGKLVMDKTQEDLHNHKLETQKEFNKVRQEVREMITAF
jgi:hypothetical protein